MKSKTSKTNYKLTATIPVGQYANIQPSIEIDDTSIEDAHIIAMDHVSQLFNSYSDIKLSKREVAEVVNSLVETKKLTSFNEPVSVDFDVARHIYTYEGKQLVSASGYTKKFGSEFASDAIAGKCEKSWGVPKHHILDMWDGNRNVTANFGTAVHETLEHYFNFKEIGDEIVKNSSKEENPALPKHPFLRSLIEDFEKMYDPKEGRLVNEVFLTDIETLRCGHADRLMILDEKKKICRIQDYKINVEADEISSKNKLKKPYDELPANKVSKYQIQMSFYADLLAKSGWTVEGLDVFIYEDKWVHHKLEVLEIVK